MMSLSLLLVSFLALCVSGKVVHEHVAEVQVDAGDASLHFDDPAEVNVRSDDDGIAACARALKDLSIHPQDNVESALSQVSLAIHHNGNPEPCGVVPPSVEALQQFLAALGPLCGEDGQDKPVLNKYQVESFLTSFLASQLGAGDSSDDDASEPQCSPEIDLGTGMGLLGHCNMGPEFTVIQKDHGQLVPVSRPDGTTSLPCRFYTREGLRISTLEQLQQLATAALETKQLDLYAVPAGRMFMFAPSHVGELFVLDHVKDIDGRSLVLQTLSVDPRVFDIYHFFSAAESERLIQKALGETSETHGFHRSTTGTKSGGSVYSMRTSENAWDTHGATALDIKKRCFSLLGIDEYNDAMSDGLQILRYNQTKAYIPHMDYLTDQTGQEIYDYDSSGKGGNRFATILLYLSDVEIGGETVFTEAWPVDTPEEERVPLDTAIQQLRDSGEADMLKAGSWEEKMAAQCRTRLAVKPNATRAVLFYSQFPDGMQDPKSKHGGCPVLKGTKIAANLWTWSGIRPEYAGAPKKREPTAEELAAKNPAQLQAVFKNSRQDARFDQHTKVYYDEDGFFGNLGPSDPDVRVNTYKGHVWNIKNQGKTLKTFVIGDEAYQEFVV